MLNRTLPLLLTALTSSVLVGCEPSKPEGTPKAQGRRLVAAAPAIGEMLFAIGAGDEVVGRSEYCSFPPKIMSLPSIGGIKANLEVIQDLAPTHVFSQSRDPSLERYALSGGFEVERFEIETVADIAAALRALGRITERGAEAEAEARRIEAAFAGAAEAADAPAVLISIGRQPGRLKDLLTCSSGFLTECLTAAGGRNAFADLDKRYPQLSLEAVLDRDPDFIIEIYNAPKDRAFEQQVVADWSAVPQLKAVKAGRVIVIDEAGGLNPGPRVTRLLERLRAAMAEHSQGASK